MTAEAEKPDEEGSVHDQVHPKMDQGIGTMIDPGFARWADDEKDAAARQQFEESSESSKESLPADFEGHQRFQIGEEEETSPPAEGPAEGVPAVAGMRPGGLLESIFGRSCLFPFRILLLVPKYQELAKKGVL